MAGITLVGLGPGEPDRITVEAQVILNGVSELWVTSPDHPVVSALPSSVIVRALPSSQRGASADPLGDAAILERVMELGMRPQGAVLAVPGHPLISSALGWAVWRGAMQRGILCRVVTAPSLPDGILEVLPIDAPMRVLACSADFIKKAHVPPFPPNIPTIITGLSTTEVCQAVRTVLATTYPADHMIELYSSSLDSRANRVPLAELGRVQVDDPEACLYLPPLAAGSSLEALQEVVAHLRAPEGCPWDRKQTHASLRPHLLEESYEAMAAMDSGDSLALREELGDLLLQIMLNAQIAAEAGDFALHDVARGIHDKLIRRHPHVFGELELDDVDGVLSNWEKLKEGERAEKGESAGLLEGVPIALPALSQAQEYQDRAARVGFDWPHLSGVLAKIGEEVQEVQDAADAAALEAELGDLLFSLVNLSRWKGIDAESALRAANQRFRGRFRFIEAAAKEQGRRLSELSLQEMDALWNQAKTSDGAGLEGA
jgi:tetrapyrrole methylase family protein / MazG family protein